MKSIWENEKEVAVLGAAARNRYLECFTAEKMCSEYYRLYCELTGSTVS
jgi:rhamnosyl/mannosyltransferase